jgi:hypothetical protein
MNQKGFTNILLIVIVISLVGTGVYFALVKKQEPVPQQITTKDWKTYRNEKYGFEVKYPSEWQVQEDYGRAASDFEFTGPVSISAGEQDNFGIQITPGSDGSIEFKNFDELSTDEYWGAGRAEKIEINGVPALRVNNPEYYRCSINFLHKKEYNKLFAVSCADTSIQKEILSTFKFIK